MRITISGMPGAGKTGASQYLAKRLNLRYYSASVFMRMLAERHNMSLRNLSKMAEGMALDKRADKLHGNLDKEDNFVIDSRLGSYFFPDAINIYLTVRPEVAVRRLIKREQIIEKDHEMIKKTVKGILEREVEARESFKRNYGIDIYDKKNYEIYIDTSDMTKAGVNKRLLKRVLALQKGF